MGFISPLNYFPYVVRTRADYTCNLKSFKIPWSQDFRFANIKAVKLPLNLSSISILPVPSLHPEVDTASQEGTEELIGINRNLKEFRGLTLIFGKNPEQSWRIAVASGMAVMV